MDDKVTFGVIVGTRGFFPAWLAEEAREQFVEKLDRMGYGCCILPEDATEHGAVETYEDAVKCAKFFRENQDDIHGIIVVLPNFGDEQGVAETLEQAGLDVPVLVQACDDQGDKLDLKHRRDAFCGKLSVCNNLYQRGIPFTNTSLHTYPLDSEQMDADIDFFARVCRVVDGLDGARIGAIGQRPDPFHTVRYSEKLLQDSGITVVVVDLSEIIAAARGMGGPRVDDRIAEIRDYGTIPEGIPEENVERAAALSLAIEDWVEENRVDATAIQCWSSIQENYGCATCLSMSLMGQKGKPSACETDVTGALTMYALQLATGQPSGYMDWNNNYDEERSKCILTHCSNYPKDFVQAAVEISNLDILGQSIGPERCFGAIKARVAAGPVTFAKISTDDVWGIVKAYTGEARFTDDPAQTPGGIAVCEVPGLQELLHYMCTNGFEHHVAMNRGHVADVLEEAFGTYMGWDVYRHRA